MCDYSLEVYKSRPALHGEEYALHRFRTGTLGFIHPGDRGTAVCLPTGARLHLEGIDRRVQSYCGIAAEEEAVMIRLPYRGNTHRDGLRFVNGREVLLQGLNVGLRAKLASRDLVQVLGLNAVVQHDVATLPDCDLAEAGFPEPIEQTSQPKSSSSARGALKFTRQSYLDLVLTCFRGLRNEHLMRAHNTLP